MHFVEKVLSVSEVQIYLLQYIKHKKKIPKETKNIS